jgi:transcriptional regulator with XRE-family HTH domain
MPSTQPPSPIVLLRAASGLAQADLAEATEVSPATISNLERGRTEISPDLRDRIAKALGCSPEALIGGDFSVVSSSGQVRIES